MAEKKLVMGDDYKDALRQKELTLKKREQDKLKKEREERHAQHRAKREAESERQRELHRSKKEQLKLYERRLKEAREAQKGSSWATGLILLICFAVSFTISVVTFVHSPYREYYKVFIVFSAFFLVSSLVAQYLALDAEKRVNEYTRKINKLRKELKIGTIKKPSQK